MNFQNLNYDILLSIWKYLPNSSQWNLSLTCRALRSVSKDPHAWKHISVNSKSLDILHKTSDYAKYCKSIRLDTLTDVSGKFVNTLFEWLNCTSNQIKSLILPDSLSDLGINSPGLGLILIHLCNIESLEITCSGESIFSSQILDFIQQSMYNCPKVKIFKEDIPFGIPVGFIRNFGKCWRNLKVLRLNTDRLKLLEFEAAVRNLNLNCLEVTYFQESLKVGENVAILGQAIKSQQELKVFTLNLEMTPFNDGIHSQQLKALLEPQMLNKFIYQISLETYLNESFGTEYLNFQIWHNKYRKNIASFEVPSAYMDIVIKLADVMDSLGLGWQLHWNY